MTSPTSPQTHAGIAYDDLGDPSGQPVLYLHGTPDSRLARHPDDSLVAAAGVRLLAVDRPGYGASTPVAAGTAPIDAHRQLAHGLSSLLDHLGLEKVAVLAWSGGALVGLTVAAELGARAEQLTLVAGLVPREAYDDPEVEQAAPHRAEMFPLADELSHAELAETLAPMLAPYPCDRDLARDHQRETRTSMDQDELDQVPGAADQMVEALVEAVRPGLDGVGLDVATQNTRGATPPTDQLSLPVHLVYGGRDLVTPPAFGRWYEAQLPHSTLTVIEEAGHFLPISHWPTLMSVLTRNSPG